jgi:hypothetical protein
MNVLEHVYDITSFLGSISKMLAQNGTLFISTVNAASLEATLLRNWWSMCKEHDHVSFPSPDCIARAAQVVDLHPERICCSEFPFEFPVSALVAARDWTRARRGPSRATGDSPLCAISTAGSDATSRARLAHFYSISARFDPTSRLLGLMGRAASVKARQRPGTSRS